MREMGNWREYQIRRLANDREAAIAYLQLTLEEYQVDRDLPFFLKELRIFVESQGGVSELSKRTSIDAETLLDALSKEDAPPFDILNTILNAFGCQLPTQHKADANFNIKTVFFSANPLKRTSLPPRIDLTHSVQRTQRAASLLAFVNDSLTSNRVVTFSD